MTWRALAVTACLAAACGSGAPPELATFPNPLAHDPDSFSDPKEIRSIAPAWSLGATIAGPDVLLRMRLLSIAVDDAEVQATLRRYGYITLDDLLPHGERLVETAASLAARDGVEGGRIPLSEMPAVLPEEYPFTDDVLALQFAGTPVGKALLLGGDSTAARRGELDETEARLRRGEALFGTTASSERGALAVSAALAARKNASAEWERALRHFRAAGAVDLLWQVHVLRAVDALSRHDSRTAVAALRNAVAEVESSRRGVRSADLRERSFAGKLLPYGLLVAMLMRTGSVADAQRYATLAKARSLQDLAVARPPAEQRLGTERRRRLAASIRDAEQRIAAAERLPFFERIRQLQDAERIAAETWFEYQTLRSDLQLARHASSARPAPPAPAQAIPPSWIVLDYFVAADRLHLWIVGTEGLLAHESRAVAYDELAATVERLRDAIVERGDYESAAAELYDLLVAPAEPFLAGRDLIVVPHQVLHFLPFEVLRHGGRFLVESHAIAYAPALGLQRFASGAAERELSFLGIGDSRSLPRPATEVKVARQAFVRGEVLLDASAARAALLRDASRFDVLHLATHVDLSPRFPLLTRIGLGGGEDVYLFEVPDLRTEARLVVLSGCNTNLGELDSGDELTALGRAFLENGVETVVVSLWEVEDRSTAEFMHLFYGELEPLGAVRALAAAKRQMIAGTYELDAAGEVVDFSHPFHWSAFVALGNAG